MLSFGLVNKPQHLKMKANNKWKVISRNMISKAHEPYTFLLASQQVLKWIVKNQLYVNQLLWKYFKDVLTSTFSKPMQNIVSVLENLLITFNDDDNTDDLYEFGISQQFSSYNISNRIDNSNSMSITQQQEQQSHALQSIISTCSAEPLSKNQTMSNSKSPMKTLTNNVQSLSINSNNDHTKEINWQSCQPTIRERNAVMFNNELMSDIRFIVGSTNKQQIPAHKYVLATGSSVFYAMFYGTLAEVTDQIEVPDIEPSAFLALLRYLYCDDIHLEADTVLATLYVAKKYIVPHLAKECVRFLELNLTAKNACLLLSQSRLFEEPELMQQCWDVIDAQGEIALKADGFVDIDVSTLELIMNRETLNCREMVLLEAILNWAEAECERREIEPTPKNKREVLGKVLYLIRIPTMSLDEFANQVAPLKIFTLDEIVDFFYHFTANKKPTLAFCTKPRLGRKAQICHRFQSCAYRNNQWRYRGRCDSFQFMVDKRIFIIGFGLYGSSNGDAEYKIKIELKRQGKCQASKNYSFYSDGSSRTFHVYFEHPVQIDPEHFYTASAILDGNELSYFGQEGMTEVTVGHVTFQFQCSSESTNGTGVQGGQIPELIYYGP